MTACEPRPQMPPGGGCPHCDNLGCEHCQSRPPTLREALGELLDCHAAVVELAGDPFVREGGLTAHNRRVDKAVAQARAALAAAPERE